MSGLSRSTRSLLRPTVDELRSSLGLFSFHGDPSSTESAYPRGVSPQIGVRPGGIVEWLVASEGAGAVTLALQMMSQSIAVTESGRLWTWRGNLYRPGLDWLGNSTGAEFGDPPGHHPGNVLVDRAMPALPWHQGHPGMGRQSDSGTRSSPLANGGGIGGRGGDVFSAGPDTAGTNLG